MIGECHTKKLESLRSVLLGGQDFKKKIYPCILSILNTERVNNTLSVKHNSHIFVSTSSFIGHPSLISLNCIILSVFTYSVINNNNNNNNNNNTNKPEH